jgi:hypothetical protein
LKPGSQINKRQAPRTQTKRVTEVDRIALREAVKVETAGESEGSSWVIKSGPLQIGALSRCNRYKFYLSLLSLRVDFTMIQSIYQAASFTA